MWWFFSGQFLPDWQAKVLCKLEQKWKRHENTEAKAATAITPQGGSTPKHPVPPATQPRAPDAKPPKAPVTLKPQAQWKSMKKENK